MSERIVLVGGVAAGAAAAAKARRANEQPDIVMIEAGPHVSFANCGLPYYLGGQIARRNDLFAVRPETFRKRFNVELRLSTEVVSVQPGDKSLEARDASGNIEKLTYDRLILATGAVPVAVPIDGLDGPNVFPCRTVPDADAIRARIKELAPQEAAGARAGSARKPRALIIGGGYVGLECAEQLLGRGFEVAVVELLDQLMGPLDPEMAQPLQTALEAAGAEVVLGDGVARIEPGDGRPAAAILQSGRRVPFDLAVIGLGVSPNVALARQGGLKLGSTGAIAVDPQQRTSDPAIFAAGDNCESVFLPTGRPVNIPLAGPANKQGRVAGANAAMDLLQIPPDDRRRLRFTGVLGTAGVRVCGAVAGVTGLTEKAALREGVKAAVTYVPGLSHARYYPGAGQILVKIVYDPADGRLLGGQVVGGDEGVDKRIDVLATAIQAGMTVEDLEQLDLCYAPPFNSARDVVIMAGFVAANSRRGSAPAVGPMELLEELAGDDAPLVVDVRSPREYGDGHPPGAVNVPVDEMRARIDEIPTDRPVVVHCETGYRSHIAQQILRNRGRENARNLLGGYDLLNRVLKLVK